VPPQSIDAERAILAALLLDAEAVGRAIELIDASVFYRVAHQRIYAGILSLYNRNEKADLVTLAEELRKRGDLEAIGGPAALAQLFDSATTSANLEQHIRIVHAKFILRSLISATTDIQQDCYTAGEETAEILDHAEQRIFEITDQRVRQGFVPLRDLLKPAFEHIQMLFERKASVTGVPSGYDDLDQKTAGFQAGDLVIIAGRPSMGKTSFALNIAENAAIPRERDRVAVPCAVFSLEMSKEQLVQRLLCSQSEVPLHKVRNGYLAQEDWPRLTTAAGLLQQAPIVIDDSPVVTVMEIRAKCRRLKAEGRLGLVMIDYLQLIRPSGAAENRVQEISQITRGLKALAKELSVPIVALSQLSRQVETRDKSGRPQLSDLRESGCLTADTRIVRADTGASVTMGELHASGERNIPVWSLDENLKVVARTMTHVFSSGVKAVFELKLASGRSVKASDNHPFLTLDGWRPLRDLAPGTPLAVMSEGEIPSLVEAAVETAPSRERLARVSRVVPDPELERLATSDVSWDRIVAIEPRGEEEVFDATVPGTHNFIANGIVAHNSIEQDADVVMFVYREVVYKRDTPEPLKAQIIIAKQRNGPTGDVDLTFLRDCTKFVPYSPIMPGETEPDF
jgi:replicative DNA helicase